MPGPAPFPQAPPAVPPQGWQGQPDLGPHPRPVPPSTDRSPSGQDMDLDNPSLHLAPMPQPADQAMAAGPRQHQQVAPDRSQPQPAGPSPDHSQPAPTLGPPAPQPVATPASPVAAPPPAVQVADRPRQVPDVDHPAVTKLYQLLNASGDGNFSDIHVHPGKPVRRLRFGNLILLQAPGGSTPLFTEEEIETWLAYATNGDPDPFKGGHQCSPAIDTGRWRVRAAFRHSLQGLTCSFRLIPRDVPLPADVGIPDHLQALTRRKSGLVLVEGGTGSGKTTFNAAMVNKANHEQDLHIYTIEDPIEYVFVEHGASTVVQREVGVHATSYPEAIEDALRSKPNIIVVGEMRNVETRDAALWAATTGHLVFTTAHSGSVAEAIDTFIGVFPANEQPQIRTRLAQSLLAVVSQQLVPTVDGRLIAAREVLINDINFSEIIRDGKTHLIPQQMAGTRGSFTMEDSLTRLVEAGRVEPGVAMAHAKNPTELEAALKRVNIRKAAA